MARTRSPATMLANASTTPVTGCAPRQWRRTGRLPRAAPSGVLGGQFGELVVCLADGVSEHPVHRALAAQDGEQPFGEPLVRPLRPVGQRLPGPLRRYRPGPALVASAKRASSCPCS